MNKSQRIYLNTGDTGNQNQDKFIKVRLEQNIDTLEFMSLKIGTADAYQNFNADYGVLVGRVNANKEVGIPNAKISIFIPLEEEDINNSDIYSIYPYDNPRTKNNEGKRYNLLPRVATKDPDTGIVTPKQPFGSFPTKEEILSNEPTLKVYKKYYKYTTRTNYAGDYMIFGVPVGTQTVHMSVDITDIGDYSMTPATMVDNLGYSENLFNESKTKILPETDLTDLVNIETQEISVDIIPFWGDTENFEIGITRQDFKIKTKIVSTFSIFGSAFTDDENEFWASRFDEQGIVNPAIRQLYRTDGSGFSHIGITTKQVGLVEHKIYYYPNTISDNEISSADPINDMKVLNEEEYSVRKENGDFVFIINCNRKKVITSETGELIEVPNNFNGGVFTEFRGFMTLEIPTDNAPINIGNEQIWSKTVSALRFKLKIPQRANRNASFSKNENTNTNTWRKQHTIFKKGNIYSIAKFHGLVYNDNIGRRGFPNENQDKVNGFLESDRLNDLNRDPFWNTGIITTNDDDDDIYQFPTNGTTDQSSVRAFGSNWLNFSLYLPHFGYFKTNYTEFRHTHSSTNFTIDFREETTCPVPYCDNNQDIAAGEKNTKWFARSDLHYTDFITVPKEDIIKMINASNNRKGFKKSDLGGITLDGDYRNGNSPCPQGGGRINGDADSNQTDGDIYFYRGYGDSDCFRLLQSLGLV